MDLEPMAPTRATLVDVLDRVLDRGLVINADVIISLAGVPLIGINLRAALAGMETMVKYGMMKEWERTIRVDAAAQRTRPQASLMAQEEPPVGREAEVPRA